MAYFGGDHVQATVWLEDCRVLARGLDNGEPLFAATRILGRLAMAQGDVARAASLLEENLTWARRNGERRPIAITLDDLSELAMAQGDTGHAATLAEEALAHYTALQHLDGVPHLSAMLGTIRLRQGDPHAAAQHLEESVRVAQTLGLDLEMAHGLAGTAALCLACGLPEPAARLSAAASAVLEAMGAPGCAPALQHDTVAASRAALGAEAFAAAWAEGQTMPVEDTIASALEYCTAIGPAES
jgi:hypothetical protein